MKMMNKLWLNITGLFLVLILLPACEKDDLGLSVSRETQFATFEMEGDQQMFVEVGTPFVDPGVKAFEGDAEVPVSVDGAVNSSETGLYTLTYSAVNSDGFPNTTRRLVFVRSSGILENDLSGQYQGAGFGSDVATVTRIAPGHYHIDRVLARGDLNIGADFFQLDEKKIVIPAQPSRFGDVAVNPLEFDGTIGEITANGFQWIVFIGCCGNFGPITFESL